MSNSIQIIEKPEWVSWDAIHDLLQEAHKDNRERGINMTHPSMPGEEIRREIGEDGVMLVALDGEKLAGVAAFVPQSIKKWYLHGQAAYMCLAGVHPSYQGMGIYRSLIGQREQLAMARGYQVFIFDTHEKNTNVQAIARKNGYKFVRYFQTKSGHNSVVMTKWAETCPFTDGFVKRRFILSKVLTKFFVNTRRIEKKHWERVYLKMKAVLDI